MKLRNTDTIEGDTEEHAVGRRALLKGAAAGAAAIVTGSALVRDALADAAHQVAGGTATMPAMAAPGSSVPEYQLTGDDIITVNAVTWPIGGGMTVDAYAYGVLGGPGPSVPGPTLRARPGQKVNITIQNNLSEPTTVHFHGVHPIPFAMDGVPGVSMPGPIPPGGSFTHSFTVPGRCGTYGYHTHENTPHQLPRGLYGLFVIEDGRRQSRLGWHMEYPFVLSTVSREHVSGMPDGSHLDAIQLINGKTFAYDPPAGILDDLGEVAGRLVFPMKVGHHVLFRTMSFSNEPHPMHTHGMCYHVVAEDGWDLGPHAYQRDTMGVLPGQRFDLIADPEAPGLWLFHCHNLDHVLEGMIAVNAVE